MIIHECSFKKLKGNKCQFDASIQSNLSKWTKQKPQLAIIEEVLEGPGDECANHVGMQSTAGNNSLRLSCITSCKSV